ncbi:Molybdate-binding periplasmic protein precursor [compost metagenome]
METGNADAGFVYKTDALTSGKVKIALTVGAHVHTAISYPVGVVKESDHLAEAKAFYNYVQTQEAGRIFTGYGFTLAK